MTDAPQQNAFLDKAAKIVRAITVPPLMVAILLTVLYLTKGEFFTNLPELLFSLFFLAIFPVVAYPLSYGVPRIREKGREGQRKLAFLFNFLGYVGAVLYGLIVKVSYPLQLIYFTYFISVAVLLAFNKILKIRASGHACSLAGPLILLIHFIGCAVVIPCVLLGVLIVWASLRLKRHTPSELLWGSLCAFASFGVSLMILMVMGG